MKYKSYSKQVIRELDKVKDKALNEIGAMVTGDATRIARDKGVWDTGLLAQSMLHRRLNKDTERTGNTVGYAAEQELGTNRFKGRPFLEPAANQKKIKDLVSSIYRREMR